MLKDASHLTSPEHVSVGLLPGFWPGGSHVRVVFCHVMGTEESPQDYTGPEGREESKHNPQEVEAVVSVVCIRFVQFGHVTHVTLIGTFLTLTLENCRSYIFP